MRVQCPQYCGQVDSSSASTLVGYRWVSPSATHMSCSCSESRVAYGWLDQSVRRSENTGSMYRRTGSANSASVKPGSVGARWRHHRVQHLRRQQHRHRRPLGLVALEVGEEAVVDAGARRRRAAGGRSSRSAPAATARSPTARVVTSAQPGSRVQSGSTSSVAARTRRAERRSCPLRYGTSGCQSNGRPEDISCDPRFRRGRPVTVRSDPTGMHRVLQPPGVLPQAAERLDTRPDLWDDEVRVRVERLNLDAASFRQLRERARRRATRCASAGAGHRRRPGQDAEPGHRLGRHAGRHRRGGRARSPLGLQPGDTVATLVSLSLTPLVIDDGLAGWDGASEQVPCSGYAILFGRSIAARLPDDLPTALSLAVMDVCGAPALTARVVAAYAAPDGVRRRRRRQERVAGLRRGEGRRSRAGHRRGPGRAGGRGAARGGTGRRGGRRGRPRPGGGVTGGRGGGRSGRRHRRLRRRARAARAARC